MTPALRVITTENTDPRRNLALEELLLRSVEPGSRILYLWQNQRTVVIGRNQDAFAECRVRVLENDGGHLVRRLSGGGAVYHDLGNLNFTFLSAHEDYDVETQTEVILRAVRSLGIPAVRTGRNDLEADGKKFSGHAYYRSGGQCMHHGTLMADVDKAALEKYLSVSAPKLLSKGVASVRSRVENLRTYRPGLTVGELSSALVAAFGKVYGSAPERLSEDDLDPEALERGTRRFSDPAWIYGPDSLHAECREGSFGWGRIRLEYTVRDGRVGKAVLRSDGLAADYLAAVPELLAGCPLDRGSLLSALRGHPDGEERTAEDIVSVILGKEDSL